MKELIAISLQLQKCMMSLQETDEKDVWGLYGTQISSPPRKLINIWVGICHCTWLTNGYGEALVRTSIGSSSGSYSRVGLNTRSILRRRNMELESFGCVLCNLQIEETIEHLFISCLFFRKTGVAEPLLWFIRKKMNYKARREQKERKIEKEKK